MSLGMRGRHESSPADPSPALGTSKFNGGTVRWANENTSLPPTQKLSNSKLDDTGWLPCS